LRDPRIVCSDERTTLCERVFSDCTMCLLPDLPALAECLAFVEFIPVVDFPVLLVPGVVLGALAALFWLPLVASVADPPVDGVADGVVADGVAPVVVPCAKTGPAATNPNAQTEANRRPLSMFYSLPMPMAKRTAPRGMHRQRRGRA